MALMMRRLVEEAINNSSTRTAVFYADKLYHFTHQQDDLYLLAKCFDLDGQPRRCFRLLETATPDGSLLNDQRFLLLAIHALSKTALWPDIIKLLDDHQKGSDTGSISASLWCERAEANLALDRRIECKRCFTEALKRYPLCYQASLRLSELCLLSAEEEKAMIASLNQHAATLAGDESQALVCHAAFAAAKATRVDNGEMSENAIAQLSTSFVTDSVDLQTARASLLLSKHHYHGAYKIAKQILQKDPYNYGQPLLVLLACLVEMKKEVELSLFAHKLTEEAPNSVVAFYAAGCYHLCMGNYQAAREHFAKATSIDKHFIHGWMAFGHAFSKRGDHDQAIAAYRTVIRLFPGDHMAAICIAREYLLTNNTEDAEGFLIAAEQQCTTEPTLYNEMGTLHYNRNEFDLALIDFQKALDLAEGLETEEISKDLVETILNNIAQVHRKRGHFPEAIATFQKALAIAPQNPATRSALAFAYHCAGDFDSAIIEYHKSLALRDDNVTADLLKLAVSENLALK